MALAAGSMFYCRRAGARGAGHAPEELPGGKRRKETPDTPDSHEGERTAEAPGGDFREPTAPCQLRLARVPTETRDTPNRLPTKVSEIAKYLIS